MKSTDYPTSTMSGGSAPPEYLRERQIVRPHGILPISRSCFREYVRQGRIAPGILLSPRVRVWARADVLAFVEAR
jgi:hypothetical protein